MTEAELSKLTSPSLWNLTVDLAARFSQTFFTRASFHRGEEVWLKSFNFKSFCDLKIIYFLDSVRLSKTSGPSRPHCAAVKSSENTAGDP